MVDKVKWLKRLKSEFSEKGIVGFDLQRVFHAEQYHRRTLVQSFRPYNVITDSFQSFFLETLELAEARLYASPKRSNAGWYPMLLLIEATLFQRLRAGENLLICGYPFFGYSLLREVKDRAIMIAAVGSGVTTLRRAYGMDAAIGNEVPASDIDSSSMRQRVKKEERRVMDIMIRSRSGLSAGDRRELRLWEEAFDLEVHGSRFTLASGGLPWLKGASSLPIMPSAVTEAALMHMNRSGELGWMVLRTLPLLQLSQGSFGTRWAKRWGILDESFRELVEEMGHTGKEIGFSVSRFVQSKFQFEPQTSTFPKPN